MSSSKGSGSSDEEVQKKGDDHKALTVEDLKSLPAWVSQYEEYSWYGDIGHVSVEVPELEEIFFKNAEIQTAGDWFNVFASFNVKCEGTLKAPRPILYFDKAGLHPVMVNTIHKLGLRMPTPIQAYAIPAVLSGLDVVGIAQTGSGKTAAYLIPVISKLMGKATKLGAKKPLNLDFDERRDSVQAQPLVLIIVPTRELAVQVYQHARYYCYRSFMRPCVAYGGVPMRGQLTELKKGCDILIGTPGRLADIVQNQPRWLSLRRLRFTIVDEADSLLADGWDQMNILLPTGGAAAIDSDHQMLFFSATFPPEIEQLALEILAEEHIRIKVGRTGSTHENIKQKIIWVDPGKKLQALKDYLHSEQLHRTIVFVRGTEQVDWVDLDLHDAGYPCTSLHANRTQYHREDAMRAFKAGKTPVLIASAVMARGIDVKNTMRVINYDLPNMKEGGITEYVHRIGRTARIGHRGEAVSFFSERDADIAEDLIKILEENNQEVPDFVRDFAPAFNSDQNLTQGWAGAGNNTSDSAWGSNDASASWGGIGTTASATNVPKEADSTGLGTGSNATAAQKDTTDVTQLTNSLDAWGIEAQKGEDTTSADDW